MLNMREIESLRTKEELIKYFEGFGKKITEAEIDALKRNYAQAQENGSVLTMQQLDKVAGGDGIVVLAPFNRKAKCCEVSVAYYVNWGGPETRFICIVADSNCGWKRDLDKNPNIDDIFCGGHDKCPQGWSNKNPILISDNDKSKQHKHQIFIIDMVRQVFEQIYDQTALKSNTDFYHLAKNCIRKENSMYHQIDEHYNIIYRGDPLRRNGITINLNSSKIMNFNPLLSMPPVGKVKAKLHTNTSGVAGFHYTNSQCLVSTKRFPHHSNPFDEKPIKVKKKNCRSEYGTSCSDGEKQTLVANILSPSADLAPPNPISNKLHSNKTTDDFNIKQCLMATGATIALYAMGLAGIAAILSTYNYDN